MKNFIFKSGNPDLHKMLFNKLEIIQSELRHQRMDHIEFIRLINKLFLELNLQKQADAYYQTKLEDTQEPSSRQEIEDLD